MKIFQCNLRLLLEKQEQRQKQKEKAKNDKFLLILLMTLMWQQHQDQNIQSEKMSHRLQAIALVVNENVNQLVFAQPVHLFLQLKSNQRLLNEVKRGGRVRFILTGAF